MKRHPFLRANRIIKKGMLHPLCRLSDASTAILYVKVYLKHTAAATRKFPSNFFHALVR